MKTGKLVKEIKVPVESVQAHIKRMRNDGWWLESKDAPQWDYSFKDNRVALRFTKPE